MLALKRHTDWTHQNLFGNIVSGAHLSLEPGDISHSGLQKDDMT